MIEFVLKAIPNEVLQGEGDACILALMQLRSAVTDLPALELRTMKHLVCNFKAWSRCTYKFQTSLVSVVATTVSAQPEYFQAHVGVQGLMDALKANYMDSRPTNDHLSEHLSTMHASAAVDLDGVGEGAAPSRSNNNNNNNSNNNNHSNSDNNNNNSNNNSKMGQAQGTPLPAKEETYTHHPDPSSLDKPQRAHIRGALLAMVTSLTLRFASEKEIRPILQFMAVCRDPVVLIEMAHLLLCVIVEGGAKVVIPFVISLNSNTTLS